MNSSTSQLVDHFFRHESARLIAVLTRAFGIRRLDLVEDMVQAALLEAMHAWKQGNIPENPAAWIHRAARNRILDALRREKAYTKALERSGQSMEAQATLIDQWLDDDVLPDSLLRMMFVCCHPELDRRTQIALTLKTLCGFGISEIGSGLLMREETVKKRIQRAKKTLADIGVQIELPAPDEMTQRLNAVHDVLYLMFNEGYSTSHGVNPVRDDICEEAARLCHLLCQTSFAVPSTKALLALMLFQAARLDSRTDESGSVVLLEDQDRSGWDVRLMGAAWFWLTESRTDKPSAFHLEAAIARQHAVASSVQETDWKKIVQLYDRLLQLQDSPIYRLNRSIAIGEAGNREEALGELQAIRSLPEMTEYLLLDCAMARLHELNGDTESAVACCQDALAAATAPHERQLLEQKLNRLTRNTAAD